MTRAPCSFFRNVPRADMRLILGVGDGVTLKAGGSAGARRRNPSDLREHRGPDDGPRITTPATRPMTITGGHDRAEDAKRRAVIGFGRRHDLRLRRRTRIWILRIGAACAQRSASSRSAVDCAAGPSAPEVKAGASMAARKSRIDG